MHPYCDYPGFVEGLLRPTLSYEEAVQQSPIERERQRTIAACIKGRSHMSLKTPKKELQQYVRSHSYFDYLKTTLGVDDPGVLRMARHSVVDYGGTPELMTMEAKPLKVEH